jgi:molybdenum cofactor synthesis domain-containing protein
VPTVAAIIIGDEILAGKFADENGPFLIRRLRELGASLARLAVIGDGLGTIAQEVRAASHDFDLVVTTGGVGPTHDDRTLEGLAKAFELPLVEDASLVALMETYDIPMNGMTLRMARIPSGAELLVAHGGYPVLKIRNVYAFPGVPRLFRSKFASVADDFRGEGVVTARVHTARRETEIAEALAAVQARFDNVAIGSYPRFGEDPHRVIITLEGNDGEAVARARREVAAAVE